MWQWYISFCLHLRFCSTITPYLRFLHGLGLKQALLSVQAELHQSCHPRFVSNYQISWPMLSRGVRPRSLYLKSFLRRPSFLYECTRGNSHPPQLLRVHRWCRTGEHSIQPHWLLWLRRCFPHVLEIQLGMRLMKESNSHRMNLAWYLKVW